MRVRLAITASILAIVLTIACGDGDAGGADGGADDAAAPDGDLAAPPVDIPWLAEGVPPIALTPCPAGWREVPSTEVGGVTTCDPYPEGGAIECPVGQGHFPGEPACAPIGSACPAGEWAEGLPDDGTVVFVRPGASGGDGTREAPLGRIIDAMTVARDGDTIALARGRYDEAVRMRLGVALRGACAAETLVSTSSGSPVVEVLSPRARVSDVTLGPSSTYGVRVDGDLASLVLEGVVVDRATRTAIRVVNGASLVARELVVRATAPIDTGDFGIGINLQYGASAEIDRAIFERNHDVTVSVEDTASRLVLSNAVVRDTQSHPIEGLFGRGLAVTDGGTLELRVVLVERNRDGGVLAMGVGARLIASDVVVRDTLPRAVDAYDGRGIGVQEGAYAEIQRVLLERNHLLGFFAAEPGTRALLSDVVIRDTRPNQRDQSAGRGVEVERDAAVEASRLLVERNHDIGILFGGASTIGVLTDVVVRDTQPSPVDDRTGRGIDAEWGASLDVHRALIERSFELGIVANAEAGVSATDLVVRDVLARRCATTRCAADPAGHASAASTGGTLVVERFAFSRSALCGVLLALDAQADLRTGLVSDHSIGACIQVPDFDVARIQDGVVYRDNVANVQVTTLPTPEPGLPTGG